MALSETAFPMGIEYCCSITFRIRYGIRMLLLTLDAELGSYHPYLIRVLLK